MRKILLILAILFSFSANSQIDISCDASFVGIYPTASVTYPIQDKLILGGSFGYNVLNPNLTERIDGIIGWNVDENLQIELNMGALSGYNRAPDDKIKRYTFHADIGIKHHFWTNAFYTLQVAYPGFMKVGLGFRLRPWNKLDVWDKQNMRM